MLNHNLRERGTWHRAWQLGRELARRGHGVTLWTAAPHHYYRPVAETREGVRIVETPSWAPLAGPDDGWGPLDVFYRAARVLAEPFDLCYAFAHGPNVAAAAWLAARVRRRPLLWDWCDWHAGGILPKRRELRAAGISGKGEPWLQQRAEQWDAGLESWMTRLAGRLTVISSFLEDLARGAGRGRDEILRLPNGADLEGIRPLDREACRKELGLGGDAQNAQLKTQNSQPTAHNSQLILGYAANYHPDQELLLRAFAGAARAVPGLRLLKTGPPFAAGLVRELNLGNSILDLGHVSPGKIPVVLGASDALALPLEDNASNRARVPFKFTDYLAAGRPVVACRVGDIREWFGGGYEAPGLASAPDAAAYGAAIARVLAPESDRAGWGAAARRLAEREFSWRGLTDRLEHFIEDWLGK